MVSDAKLALLATQAFHSPTEALVALAAQLQGPATCSTEEAVGHESPAIHVDASDSLSARVSPTVASQQADLARMVRRLAAPKPAEPNLEDPSSLDEARDMQSDTELDSQAEDNEYGAVPTSLRASPATRRGTPLHRALAIQRQLRLRRPLPQPHILQDTSAVCIAPASSHTRGVSRWVRALHQVLPRWCRRQRVAQG